MSVIAIGAVLCGLIAYQVDATVGNRIRYQALKGVVTDTHNRPVAGATVYFIDSTTINTTPITPAAITSGAAEAYDEPLEDIVNNATVAKTLPQAKTNAKGQFGVKKLNKDGTYYAFVLPAATDTNHLPGGSASRIAFVPKAIPHTGLQIMVSWNYPAGATYIGASACYVCHGAGGPADVTSNKKHGHALMFHRPGQDTANQDSADHPGSSWNALASKFVPSTDYKTPVAAGTSSEILYFQEYSASQSNKFVIHENTPGTNVDPTTGNAGDIWFKVYLWQSALTTNANYYVTLVNVINKNDPNSPTTLQVACTMGGYIRQAVLVKVPGLKSLYKFFMYQALPGSASQGTNTGYDRSRKPFVEAAVAGTIADYFTFNSKSPSASTLRVPTAASSDITCAVCHTGGGNTTTFTDATTGETLAHTVPDSNGAFDLGGDGITQDLGVSCEQCHGPGSAHRDQNLKSLPQAPTTKKGSKTVITDTTGEYIVNPGLLGNDRASLICGRCHTPRGILADEVNNFPPVGISRAQYMAKYVNPANKGATASNLWPDGMFERGGHHSFTYQDWLLSKHMRNSRQLVACDDCHDAMGDSPYRYFLKGDPDDPQMGLCSQCHAIDVTQHVPEKTGSVMAGEGMKCINCHMPRTGKGGAGRPGLILGTPTGLSSDANLTYWEGDQSAHIWKPVAHKFDAGVAGVQPGLARPTPYTNSCGTCHDASKLQFQAPQ